MDDMMSSIAAASMSMSAQKAAMSYDIAMQKAAMKTEEQLAETLINEMMPAVQAIPKGQFIDMFI